MNEEVKELADAKVKEFTSAFKSEERLEVVKVLLKAERNLSVEEIAKQIQLDHTEVKEHLRALEEAGLVRGSQFKPQKVEYFKWVIFSWEQFSKGKYPTDFVKTNLKDLAGDLKSVMSECSTDYEEVRNALEQWFKEHEITLEIDKLLFLSLAVVVARIPEEWVSPLEKYFLKNNFHENL